MVVGAQSLGSQFAQSLWKDLLDPLLSRCIDPQGGYHQSYDFEWNKKSDQFRDIVFQSRVVWTVSTAIRLGHGEPTGLQKIAEHGLNFLKDRFLGPDGGLAWSIGWDEPGAGSGDRMSYGIAFAIYAGSAAYRAYGSETGLAIARGGFEWLMRVHHDPIHRGWHERSRPGGVLLEEPDHGELDTHLGAPRGVKVQNSHLHILEAFTELLQAQPEADDVRAALVEALECVGDKLFCPVGTLYGLATEEWQPIPKLATYGHDVEGGFLIWDAARVLGQAERWEPVVHALMSHARRWGFDSERGGMAESGEALAPPTDVARGWWTQAETLLAWCLSQKLWPDEGYQDALQRQWDWIRNHQIDSERGGWHAKVLPDGSLGPYRDKAGPWKVCYHEGRALMIGALLLG